ADALAEEVHVPVDADFGPAHEERGELARVLAKGLLDELALDAIDPVVALEAEEVVAARGRQRLQQGADRGRLELGPARKHAGDDAVAGRVDNDALPGSHVSGAQDER